MGTSQCEYEFSGVGMWATIASITTMNLNAMQEIREKASDQLIENPQHSPVQQRLLNELIILVCTWRWSVPSGHREQGPGMVTQITMQSPSGALQK